MKGFWVMMLLFALFLFISFALNIGVIWLSFLNWYERELRYNRIFVFSLLISSIIALGLYSIASSLPLGLTSVLNVVSTTLFFLVFPELYLLAVWIRKGSHKSFLVLSVASFITVFWVILPFAFFFVPGFGPTTIVIAVYVAGVVLGTLFSIAVVEEVTPRDGYVTASAATVALTISDSVSKYIYNFAIFGDIRVQLAILVGSALLSWWLYTRATD